MLSNPMVRTLRKHVLLIVSHLLGSYGAWFLMYRYAHWFVNWAGFFTFVVSVLCSAVLCVAVCAIFILAMTKFEDFYNEEWVYNEEYQYKRAYNREMLAIPFLGFATFMVHRGSFEGLDMLIFGFFLFFGAYLFLQSIVKRYQMTIHIPVVFGGECSVDVLQTEWITGIVYVALSVASAFGFRGWGMEWMWHIGFDSILFFSGLTHLLFGVVGILLPEKSRH